MSYRYAQLYVHCSIATFPGAFSRMNFAGKIRDQKVVILTLKVFGSKKLEAETPIWREKSNFDNLRLRNFAVNITII